MKKQTMLGMLGVVFAITIGGVFTVSAVSTPTAVGAYSDSTVGGQMYFLGHITLTTTDQDGNVKSYLQTDNIIVNEGENCVAEVLFKIETGGLQGCENELSADGYNFIAIGESTMIDPDSPVGAPFDAIATDEELEGEIMRMQADPLLGEVNSAEGDNSGTVITLATVFTADMASVVNESGLFDREDTTTDNMLARQTFAPQTLVGADKLTVQWDITIGS